MGTEGVKIKRAKYLEAGEKVDVHAFVCGKFLSELQNYLISVFEDINGNVNRIEQGIPALLKTVRELLEGELILNSEVPNNQSGLNK